MTTLLLTRTIDAPCALVFDAWTDAKKMEQWFGPHGFQSHSCELDARPGGAWRIVMRGPDGTDYPTAGIYREVDAPRRLVFTTALQNSHGEKILEALHTLTLAENDGKTSLTLQAVILFSTPEAEPMLAGMEEGWAQTLDRLIEHVQGGKSE